MSVSVDVGLIQVDLIRGKVRCFLKGISSGTLLENDGQRLPLKRNPDEGIGPNGFCDIKIKLLVGVLQF